MRIFAVKPKDLLNLLIQGEKIKELGWDAV